MFQSSKLTMIWKSGTRKLGQVCREVTADVVGGASPLRQAAFVDWHLSIRVSLTFPAVLVRKLE